MPPPLHRALRFLSDEHAETPFGPSLRISETYAPSGVEAVRPLAHVRVVVTRSFAGELVLRVVAASNHLTVN